MNVKVAGAILKGTVAEFSEDKALRLGAALAYYSVFSLAPLLMIAIGVAGLLFGEENVRRQVSEQISSLVGQGGAQTIESMMAARSKDSNIFATIVGVVVLFLGASGVFGQLQDALNTIWEVKPKPGTGLRGFIRTRFLSMAMVLGTGFLLLVSLLLTTAVSAAARYLENLLSVPEPILHALNLLLSFGVVTLLFAMIFKFLPDAEIKWRDVWVGAVGTALLFAVGKYVLGLYLGREAFASAYGAAGSFVVILLWVYYSSLILLFGAEFTQVYARKTGSWIGPAENAVPVTEADGDEGGVLGIRQPNGAFVSANEQQEEHAARPSQAEGAEQRRRSPAIEDHPIQLMALIAAAFLLPMVVRRQAARLLTDVVRPRKARRRKNKRRLPAGSS